jgi:hypothetical protein
VKSLIFLLLQTCQHQQIFLNHPSHIWCANPSRTFFFDRIYQALMTSRPPFFTAWFAPRPAPSQRSDQSLQYLHSTRTCYCAVIISSTISSNSVVKSSDGRFAISPQRQKPRVRPSERPAGLGLTSATFLASDRKLYRCGAQTFSLK